MRIKKNFKLTMTELDKKFFFLSIVDGDGSVEVGSINNSSTCSRTACFDGRPDAVTTAPHQLCAL